MQEYVAIQEEVNIKTENQKYEKEKARNMQ